MLCIKHAVLHYSWSNLHLLDVWNEKSFSRPQKFNFCNRDCVPALSFEFLHVIRNSGTSGIPFHSAQCDSHWGSFGKHINLRTLIEFVDDKDRSFDSYENVAIYRFRSFAVVTSSRRKHDDSKYIRDNESVMQEPRRRHKFCCWTQEVSRVSCLRSFPCTKRMKSLPLRTYTMLK